MELTSSSLSCCSPTMAHVMSTSEVEVTFSTNWVLSMVEVTSLAYIAAKGLWSGVVASAPLPA